MGLCQYIDFCFHASSLSCLHTFWHTILSFYFLVTRKSGLRDLQTKATVLFWNEIHWSAVKEIVLSGACLCSVGLSVFTITTDTQYAITSLHKYPFWLLIILDHLESDQVPLVAHGWNCHNCNQRLKFSTELCVLFIYIFGMENICTQIMWTFNCGPSFPSIQWIVRSSSRNTNASVSVAWLQAFPASSLSFCMKKRAWALVHADRTIKNWPTQSQPCMVLLQPSLAATMCMHPAGEPPSFTCPTLSVDIEHTCKHGETVVSV